MSFIPFGAGGSGSELPSGYTFKKNETTGALQLWLDDVLVSEQSPDGSWFSTSISTGVGSLHLGGNESGGKAHSLSSCGQNVGFKNDFSVADPKRRWFFYPPWEAVRIDGSQRLRATYTKYGTLNPAFLPNGGINYTASTSYNFTLNVSSNFETYSVTVIPSEDYTGVISNSILSNVTGAEVFSTKVSVVAVKDNPLLIEYDYPFRARQSDSYQLRLIKEDGSFLATRVGTSNINIPYRSLSMAPFEDVPIVTPSIGDTKFSYNTTDNEGWVLLDGRSVNTLPPIQKANAAKLGWNTSIPDTRGKMPMAASSTILSGSTGGSATIARSDLPNFTLSVTGTTASVSAGKPTGIISIKEFGSYNRAFAHDQGSGVSVRAYGFGSISGNTNVLPIIESNPGANSISDTIMDHTHSFSGNLLPVHDHTFSGSSSSLNGGVTQTQHLPPYSARNEFVYLGL